MFEKYQATIYLIDRKGKIELYDIVLDLVVLKIKLGRYEIYVHIKYEDAIKLAKDILGKVPSTKKEVVE